MGVTAMFNTFMKCRNPLQILKWEFKLDIIQFVIKLLKHNLMLIIKQVKTFSIIV